MSGATRQLPTGEVTFAFTDIERSTNLLRTLGDERYDAVLRQHLAYLAAAIEANGGTVVNTEGDSCFAAFASADHALAACTTAQADLHAHPWPDGASVRVRMGLHSGLAQPRNDDYSALAVHQAARLMSAASGGQIFVSGATASLLQDPARFDLQPLGCYQVRDFDEPIAIYELHDSRWPPDPRPPRVRPADGHNIPRPATALLGRERELTTIGEMVAPGTIVAIVGPGGVGKTRLAIEIGRTHASRWTDGAWFVGLGSLTSPEQVAGAIITAARGVIANNADPMAVLVDSLAEKSTLLILDNCEHVLDECARLTAALLTESSTVGIITTSRTPLGLTAERVWRLESLATESSDQRIPPAVQLFLDRAESGGALADTVRSDLDGVADLCRRLDGLPLAIELAAANAHRSSIAGLIEAIGRGSSRLASRDPSSPQRHRSLDDLVSWGYDLLTARDQLVARCLSVLPAAFDERTAQAAAGVDQPSIEQALASLVDSSFLMVGAEHGGIRYRQLGTVRAILGKASDDDERRSVVARLAEHFLAVLGPTIRRDRAWTSDVAIDLDNVRAVIGTSHPDIIASQQALGWVIGRYLDSTDQFALALAEVGQMLAVLDGASAERVALQCILADVRLRVGDLSGAAICVAEAELLSAAVGVPTWDDVCVARTKGDIALRSRDLDLALATVADALALSPSPIGAARLWNLAGLAHTTRNDLDEAVACFRRELDAWTVAGDSGRAATAESNLAEVLLRGGDEVGAATYQLRCLEHAMTFGLPVPCAFSMVVAARILATQSRFVEALRMQGAADRLLAENNFVLYDTDIDERRDMIARVAAELGDERVSAALDDGATTDIGSAVELTATVLRELIREGAGHG